MSNKPRKTENIKSNNSRFLEDTPYYQQQTIIDKIFFRTEEAARYIGYKTSYLYKLRARGQIPSSKSNNGKLQFAKRDLDEFLQRNYQKASYQIEEEAVLRLNKTKHPK